MYYCLKVFIIITIIILAGPHVVSAKKQANPTKYEVRTALKNKRDTSITEDVEMGFSGKKHFKTEDKPKGEFLFNSNYKSNRVKLSDNSEQNNYTRKADSSVNWFLNEAWSLFGNSSVESNTQDNLVSRVQGLGGIMYDFFNLYNDSQDAKISYNLGLNEEVREIFEKTERVRRSNTIGSWQLQLKHTSEDKKFTNQLIIWRYETLHQAKESVDDAPDVPHRTTVDAHFRVKVNEHVNIGYTYKEECMEKTEKDNPLCHQETGLEMSANF